MSGLSVGPYLVIILIIVSAIVLRRRGRIMFSRHVIISAVITLIAFQTLVFIQGSLDWPDPDSSLALEALAVFAVVMAFNTMVQLVRWVVVELIARQDTIYIPTFILDLASWLLTISIALVVIRQVYGVELTGLLITSTVVSAVIGLSLQDSLSNLFAGLFMQVDAPFTVNDWVEVDGQEGKVVRLNWRTLAILTRRRHFVLLPNNNVAQGKIVNYSRPTRQQGLDAYVGVAYPHPPGKVKDVLTGCLREARLVLADPPPQAHVESYDDFAITYRVRYWIVDYEHREDAEDEVMTRFWYALKRAGMMIPFPIRDVNMRMVTEEQATQAEEQELQDKAAFLRSLPWLAAGSDEQIEKLATAANRRRFARGETLVLQGDEGDSLFVITDGLVDVFVSGSRGGRVRSDQGEPGSFFGEMSLLTGEPRAASVVANQDTDVLVLGKEAFVDVLTTDPQILEILLGAVEERRDRIETHLAARSAEADETAERGDLLNRIAGFLGISLG